jgi:hypothetical protein
MLNVATDCLYVNHQQFHRLITHEDARFMHMHKVFGSLALLHFIYRITNWVRLTTLAFDASGWTLVWICIHAMLHASSFQFIIPNRRNKVYNIIWPEMRWHSLIFAYRSLAIMLVIWMFERGIVGSWIMYTRGPIVMATMVAADYVTTYYKNTDTTMRNNPFPSYVPPAMIKAINTFYSLSQVAATMNMLFKGKSHAFLTLIAIQTAPFCMTLVKKGIINQGGWHVLYIAALLINLVYAKCDGLNVPNFKLMIAYFIMFRFILNGNKYMIWGSIIAYQCYMISYNHDLFMDIVAADKADCSN